MAASSEKLARAFATRLNGVVPHGLAVRASGSMVYLYAGNAVVGGTASVPIVEEEEDGGTLCERLLTVVYAVLSTIQNDVSEYLTEQWPPDADGQMALVDSRCGEERVYLWYGSSEAAPVIAFPPIEFAEFMGAAGGLGSREQLE